MRTARVNHVQTVLVRKGEWVTVDHNQNSHHVIVSTYTLEGNAVFVTWEHVNKNSIRLTLGGWTWHELEDGKSTLIWHDATEDHYVRVVVLL